MPSWIIAPLITVGVLLAAWWADNRVTIIIVELKAIRENLDKLWSEGSREESEGIPAQDREGEVPGKTDG